MDATALVGRIEQAAECNALASARHDTDNDEFSLDDVKCRLCRVRLDFGLKAHFQRRHEWRDSVSPWPSHVMADLLSVIVDAVADFNSYATFPHFYPVTISHGSRDHTIFTSTITSFQPELRAFWLFPRVLPSAVPQLC